MQYQSDKIMLPVVNWYITDTSLIHNTDTFAVPYKTAFEFNEVEYANYSSNVIFMPTYIMKGLHSLNR